MRRGRYYLSRVVKMGALDHDQLCEAIIHPKTISVGKFNWTITDVDYQLDINPKFIYGRLSKYSHDGHVRVVDENSMLQVEADAPNLVFASSPFVYLPYYSGIAYLHVWNNIQETIFPKRFKSIILASSGNFFRDCVIESISDYRSFIKKLEGLDTFLELDAKVYPPNPLFGRLWKDLEKYIKKRRASEVSVKESSDLKNGLKTNIVVLLKNIMENPQFEPDKPADITDAAMLMAADGYGRGKVIGIDHDSEVVIRTADTKKSFLFSQDPSAKELADIAARNFERVNKERNLKH